MHAHMHNHHNCYVNTGTYSPFSGSGDGGVANSSRVYLPILPVAAMLSTPAYYGVAGMFYFLGLIHLLLSVWMITEHYMLMKPFILEELKAYA